MSALRIGLSSDTLQRLAARRFDSGPSRPLSRFGLRFKNPLGVAAGFDKNAVVVNQLASLGFGFVEVGTLTHRPQKGNEKPRLFRLMEDRALINRLGFNNEGAAVVSERLRHLRRRCVVGVNIGKNKDVPNEEAIENYLACFDVVHGVADYIAVNISSPNTPNLRELQRGENLEQLLTALTKRNRDLSRESSHSEDKRRIDAAATDTSPDEQDSQPKGARRAADVKPILVKIAPDLSEGEIEAIVDVCARTGVSGIIATNTTTARDGLRTRDVEGIGPGGLSGRPLAARSTEVIRTIFRHSKGTLPIVGVGGIFSAEDAFEKIASGASLLQAYTGFVYRGPSFASQINRGLQDILEQRGFSNVDDAVGSGLKG